MDSLPAFLIAPLGLFAGLLFVSFLSHWVVLLLSAMRKDSPDSRSSTRGNWSNAAVILAFCSPSTFGVAYRSPIRRVRLYQHPPNAVWLWFFGSALVGVIGMVVVVVLEMSSVSSCSETTRRYASSEQRACRLTTRWSESAAGSFVEGIGMLQFRIKWLRSAAAMPRFAQRGR